MKKKAVKSEVKSEKEKGKEFKNRRARAWLGDRLHTPPK
jgi:hypothetical protein